MTKAYFGDVCSCDAEYESLMKARRYSSYSAPQLHLIRIMGYFVILHDKRDLGSYTLDFREVSQLCLEKLYYPTFSFWLRLLPAHIAFSW